MEHQSAEIGPYRVVRTLGSGTTGTVKLAVHKDTNEEVAIKIIKKSDFATKPNLQMKIHREISLMKIVSHPQEGRLQDGKPRAGRSRPLLRHRRAVHRTQHTAPMGGHAQEAGHMPFLRRTARLPLNRDTAPSETSRRIRRFCLP